MPDISPDMITSDFSADIVIVGGGHAGTQCAMAAAEGGLSVLVIERQTEEKMSWFGEQIAAYNSKFHIERGFGPYDTDDIIDELYRCSGYLADPVLIAKYVENSGEMIDHMMTLVTKDSTLFQPEQFDIQEAWGKPQYPVVIGGHRSWAATMIFRGKIIEERGGPEYKYPERGSDYQVNQLSRLPEFEMLALHRSVELGAEWHYGARAVAICQESDGRVTGVIAKMSDGNFARFKAGKAVVLSSGNFSSTGLDLGLWAGGYTEPVTNLRTQMNHVRHGFGTAPFLTLNRDGNRFMDESIPYAVPFALDQQPDGTVCCISDAKIFRQIQQCGIQHGNADFGRPEYINQSLEDISHVKEYGSEGYLVRDMNTSEREKHRMFATDTLDELAVYMGYEGEHKENFLRSVERYNQMCYRGKDTDFRKDPKTLLPVDEPPFYGMKDNLKRENRTGGDTPLGLVADGNFKVLRPNGDPIPGLYAIGNCLGRRFGTYYPTPSGGQYIGFAMTHGRVLGKELSEKKARLV